MAGQRTMRERREREAGLQANADETMAAICEAQSVGTGFLAWCTARDVAYSRMIQWVEADPHRADAFDAATRARAANAASAVEAIGRRLINPDAPSDHDWVPRRTRTVSDYNDAGEVIGTHEELVELDPRAARVAAAAFQWTAEKGDRTKFGKHTEHHHTHAVQFEHLAALRAMMSRSAHGRAIPAPDGPVSARSHALPAPIDAEFRPLLPFNQRLTLDQVRARIRLRRTLSSPQQTGAGGFAV